MRIGIILFLLVAAPALAEYADYEFVPPVVVTPPTTPKAGEAMPKERLAQYLERAFPARVLDVFSGQNENLLKAAEQAKIEVAAGLPLDMNALEVFGEAFEDRGQQVFLGSITSVDALAVRLQVNLTALEEDETLWVVDPNGPRAYGPYGAANGTHWLPTIQGDTAVLMLCSPRSEMPSVRVEGLSHFFAPLNTPEKVLPCPTPAECDTNTVVQEVSTAIAMLIIPASAYSQLQCTGTLINNPATAVLEPLMITANHCFEGTVNAAEIDVIWDYRTKNCAGDEPAELASVPHSDGKTILVLDSVLDGAFLRLAGAPVGDYGRAWLGWDTRIPLYNDSVITIHHPAGTHKKISYGNIIGMNLSACLDLFCMNPVKHQVKVNWDEGITQSGSSGAPLLYAALNYRMAGMLSNGNEQSCSTPSSNADNFSSFQYFFPKIACYLTASGTCEDPTAVQPTCAAKSAFGEASSEVAKLRVFRDKMLMKSATGQCLTRYYYEAAPSIAKLLDKSATARALFRIASQPFVDAGAKLQ